MSKISKHKSISLICPCGLEKYYSECCKPFHLRVSKPDTAEKLMRSRYSAYVLNLSDYIIYTWHNSTAPQSLTSESPLITWLSLKVNDTWHHPQDNQAFVDFEAKYKLNGKAYKMHEVSRFIFENEQWFYIDGEIL